MDVLTSVQKISDSICMMSVKISVWHRTVSRCHPSVAWCQVAGIPPLTWSQTCPCVIIKIMAVNNWVT